MTVGSVLHSIGGLFGVRGMGSPMGGSKISNDRMSFKFRNFERRCKRLEIHGFSRLRPSMNPEDSFGYMVNST